MSNEPNPDRPRTHPSARFAASEHRFDLAEVAEFLVREGADAVHGHRQVAVYKRGPTTMILFAFEAGGVLKDHTTGGLATIHCIDGNIEVETADNLHTLGPRQLVVLDSHVRHSVRARDASQKLLTVHLDPAG